MNFHMVGPNVHQGFGDALSREFFLSGQPVENKIPKVLVYLFCLFCKVLVAT